MTAIHGQLGRRTHDITSDPGMRNSFQPCNLTIDYAARSVTRPGHPVRHRSDVSTGIFYCR